ncbi:MAG: GDP-mannose 4,6-dehydratase [Sedimentisphaerales bacterium]|nr:GDP-mannose 4,6-dehydratase [Sedimentisphaerales bacterium]
MKALITGGAGFIGSHLAEKLLQTGHEVMVIDDLSTGRMDNIAGIKDDAKFQFILESVRNYETMHILAERCDVIFHLAAAVGVQLILDEPVRTIETNIHGTEVVLEVANKFRKKVVLASTSEVYGKSEAVPFREDDDTVLGSTRFSRWSYACSKAIDEFLGLAYYQQYGLPVVVVRLFNTVGPRQTGQYGMVLPRFIQWALQGEPVQIYGTGKQARCFCYVKDVVEALVGLINNPESPGKVYNVGSTEEITIEDLADKIISMTGDKSRKKYVSYEEAYGKPFDDMMRRVPCLDRIKETIGFEVKTSLNEILENLIHYYQSNN